MNVRNEWDGWLCWIWVVFGVFLRDRLREYGLLKRTDASDELNRNRRLKKIVLVFLFHLYFVVLGAFGFGVF